MKAKAIFAILLLAFSPARAQTPSSDAPTLSARSTLVLIPALVRTKAGELVFTLTANDFLVTDDGVEQKLTLQDDSDGDPLALVIAVETGGSAVSKLDEYRGIGPSIEAMVGNVPHRIAVVTIDSAPTLLQPFTPDISKATAAINKLEPGDRGAAILDGLGYSVDLLRTAPAGYRRAILLISETVDHGSALKIEDAIRAVSDTNTAIYSLGFSSSKSQVVHELSKLNNPEPGPAHGCMSKDTSASSDPPTNRWAQLWDCLGQLAPPLRAVTMATIVGNNALRHNVPETVAQLTGGEYVHISNTRNIERSLQTFSNHVPNRYFLSFQPANPHPGFHYLAVRLRDRTDLTVTARSSYWADGPTAPSIPIEGK